MKAIILAAGKGNRLKPHTDHTPKPLLKIGAEHTSYANISLLEYVLKSLPVWIDEAVIVAKHHKDQIDDFVQNNAFEIQASTPHLKRILTIEQTEAKGTMGAVLSVQHLFDHGFEKFLILNGDDIHEATELARFMDHPRTFGVEHRIMPGYKSIEIDSSKIVTGLRTQTDEELANGCLIATGVYLVDTDLFSFEPAILTDGEIGLPQTLLKHIQTYPMHAVTETKWLPVNSHEDLEMLRNRFS